MRLRRISIVFTAAALMLVLALPVVMLSGLNTDKEELTEVYLELGDAAVPAGKDMYCWGLKRGTNGTPPEADPAGSRALEAYGGKYIGDTNEKTIYLTFDEGYENGYTSQILDVLQENNVKAIFFITGDYLKREPELVRRMIEEGHEVGNHTMSHPSMPSLSSEKIEEEILSLSNELYGKFGVSTRLLRPPKGEYNEKVLKTAADISHRCILWSFAYKDWLTDEQKGAEYAYNSVMPNLHNGAVLLLHAVSADNAAALDRIIKDAVNAGYRFGTADELLASEYNH